MCLAQWFLCHDESRVTWCESVLCGWQPVLAWPGGRGVLRRRENPRLNPGSAVYQLGQCRACFLIWKMQYMGISPLGQEELSKYTPAGLSARSHDIQCSRALLPAPRPGVQGLAQGGSARPTPLGTVTGLMNWDGQGTTTLKIRSYFQNTFSQTGSWPSLCGEMEGSAQKCVCLGGVGGQGEVQVQPCEISCS